MAKLLFTLGALCVWPSLLSSHANRVPLLRPGQASCPSYLGLPLNGHV